MNDSLLPIFNKIDRIAEDKFDSIAVMFEEQSQTYLQLKQTSTRIAHYLFNEFGQKNRSGVIAVYLDPCLHLPTIFLAIMKAGFTYVPLSDFHPLERIATIINDSSSFLVITSREINQRNNLTSLSKTVQFIEDLMALPESLPPCALPDVAADDLAYILYTSGSTGTPKGVLIEHANMDYYLNWFNEDLWPVTRTRLPLTASLSFAAAVTQLYAPLLRGDTLHILPKNILQQYPVLLNWYRQYPDGALYCVPTIWEELLNYVRQQCDTDAQLLPKTVFLSGEVVSNNLKNRTFREVPDICLFNLYGPTEATANGSFSRLWPENSVTIGNALRGSELLIVDEQCLEVEPGEVGEICIMGDGVSRGYINREDLTHQRFYKVERQGRTWRVHRTGDLGKMLNNNEVLYLGRCDQQFKINGVRIAAEEIEHALISHTGIAKAIVRCDDSLTTPRIIAYLVATHVRIAETELRRFVSTKLPTVMVPACFIYLNAIPKLPNGKLDTHRLPKPSPLRPSLAIPFVSAANELEQEIIDIWQDVLGIVNLGANDNFFELGGNSLKIMQVRYRIRHQLYADIDFDCFFANPTPRMLASVVPYYSNNDIVRHDDKDESQGILSSQQRYFLTLELMNENLGLYQIYCAIDIHGSINKSAVNHSVSRILEQNAVLRTQFDLNSDPICSRIVPVSAVNVPLLNVVLPEERPLRDRVLLEIACRELAGFEQSPLADFWLLENAPEHHVLLCRVHHTLFDHDAITPFFRQFVSYYQAFLAGDTMYRIKADWQYADYCRKQRKVNTSEQCVKETEFWRQTLAGYRRQGAVSSPALQSSQSEGHNYLVTLNAEQSAQLRHFSQQNNVTPFITLLTLFSLALQKTAYCNQPIGIPTTDRVSQEDADTIGCFVNMTSFFIDINSEEPFNHLLTRCKKHVFSLLENQHLPYQDIVNALRHSPNKSLLYFSTGFNYLTTLPETININNCQLSINEIYSHYFKLDLTLLIQDAESFTLCFNYNPQVFSEGNLKALSKEYLALLLRIGDWLADHAEDR
ncbi:AMP-binding protein [Xenorhabdus griffiniae]|uniref:AMP-binding protein n=1 Tax=Xenorhabdus griffiniae TaxID=351672 RepID=UPI002358CED2|nr:AMP-binding protein [Xenorhabdus griffiniae]MDC9606045.1 AMP-binding protein [Xenorhabdus griffiniae]